MKQDYIFNGYGLCLINGGAGRLPTLAIIRRLDFSFEARKMSVIVRALTQDEGGGKPAPLMLLSKGAPEALKSCCSSAGLPDDYDRRLFDLSSAGWRVLSCAYRSLGAMSVEEAMRASRSELETGLTFCGFLLIGNELKPTTVSTLNSVKAAGEYYQCWYWVVRVFSGKQCTLCIRFCDHG